VGIRSISDELSVEEPPDSTSTSYLAAIAEMGQKGRLEEPSSAITRILGDFMRHQAEQPRS